MVCNQTGKKHLTRVDCLSKPDGHSLQKKDMVGGSQLLFECAGKSYPVTIIVAEQKENVKPRENSKGKDNTYLVAYVTVPLLLTPSVQYRLAICWLPGAL